VFTAFVGCKRIVPGEPSTLADSRSTVDAHQATVRLPFRRDLHPEFRFDTFAIGPSNNLAYAAAAAVCEAPGHIYNPLLLLGGEGVGKTHLLQAICHRLLSNTGLRIAYCANEEDFRSLTASNSIIAGRPIQTKPLYSSFDAVLLDNFHQPTSRDRIPQEVLEVIHDLTRAKKQVVLSVRSSRDESNRFLAPFLAQLASTFSQNLTARLEPPTADLRVTILQQKARSTNVELSCQLADMLAHSVSGNIRDLEGVFFRAIHLANHYKTKLTADLIHEALQTEEKPPQTCFTGISISRILQTIQDYYRLTERELLSRSKTRSIVLPRQVGMYLARKLTQLSLAEIGRHFGARDHTTVLYAEGKIRDLELSNPRLRADLKILTERLFVTCP